MYKCIHDLVTLKLKYTNYPINLFPFFFNWNKAVALFCLNHSANFTLNGEELEVFIALQMGRTQVKGEKQKSCKIC